MVERGFEWRVGGGSFVVVEDLRRRKRAPEVA